jgi:uncharacterized protein (TIGR03437 family)
MRGKVNKFSRWNRVCIVLPFCATAIAIPAQTFTTLVTFNGTNGRSPSGTLVQGTDGNLYGTTHQGGVNNSGTVFKITPGGTLTTLYSFCSLPNCADGYEPVGLIQASDGNFYGITPEGGAIGAGTVFKLTPGGTETILYSFCSQTGCADGDTPSARVIQASDGNFYGTTYGGGANNGGTIFRVTPGGTLTTLHSFSGYSSSNADGTLPIAALIQATDGNLYGTSWDGGAYGQGTVFQVTLGGTFTTLHSFCPSAPSTVVPNQLLYCTDGAQPDGDLIQASDGNIYGTAFLGGANGYGTVFKLTPGGTLTTLHAFCSQAYCADGAFPLAGLIQASDGNFYGTTPGEFAAATPSTLFKITAGGTLTTLNTFCAECPMDEGPRAALIQASDGNLYGTTVLGGADSDGTVFELVLASSTAAPVISQSGGVVDGASFQDGIAPNSWITIFGTNLSSITDAWTSAVVDGTLPTSLDGVKVSVGGEPAYIYSISPTQINALAPNVGAGAVPVTVTNSNGTSSAITVTAQAVQPAFFQWPGNYAVATRQDYSFAVKNGTFAGTTTTPAKPGDVIILWGSGFGSTSPAAPVGVVTPSLTTYNTANTVTVTVGSVPATVYGAALAAGDAGLYQVAIQIPTSLANGDYAVIATISGAESPSTTLITVQN